MKVLSSIHVRIAANSDFLIGALGHKNRWNVEIVRGEAKVQFELFFSLIDEIKNLLNMEGWEAMPRTSIEYQFNRFLRAYHEAFGLNQVGYLDNSKQGIKTAISTFEKARDIFTLFGCNEEERGWIV
jgi:hypothetical protein